jgi:hypothetical protein
MTNETAPTIEFRAEQSAATYRWTFDNILAALPTPGTKMFSLLCRELGPYGISPTGISFESPTSFLSDVVFRVGLLDGRVALRISYSGFELSLDSLLQGDDELLVKIADSVFGILREVDPNSGFGKPEVGLTSHLTLLTTDLDAFLLEQLPKADGQLNPEAFAYGLKPNDSRDNREFRVIVMRSVRFKNAVFINFVLSSKAPESPARTAEVMSTKSERTLALLGLKRELEDTTNEVSNDGQ